MGWIVSIVLLLFYGLGIFVFHAPRTIHVLPLLAIAVVLVDQLSLRLGRRDRS